MQYFIEERHTASPMAQIFVQPHPYGFSPFDQQKSHLYCYDRRAAAAIERQHLLIERQLALERERERQRRRAFLLRKIVQEERQQAELDRYYQWQLKRQLVQQQEQQRRRQQAELLERQRRIELLERQRRLEQQEYQERYAKAISLMLSQFFTDEDEDEEVIEREESESQQEQEQKQEEKQEPVHVTVEPRFFPVVFVKAANDPEDGEEESKAEDDQMQQQQQQGEEQENRNQADDAIQGYAIERDDHSDREETETRSVHDKEVTESTATHAGTIDANDLGEDDRMWEKVSTSSDDESDNLDEKHERLRLIGEQLAQLSEKHANTLPKTRLQFQDDVSEVTATSAENRQFLGLEDEVIQMMLQLDSIQSGGSDAIRKERKALIHQAEKLLESMDEHKQHEWERVSVHSTTSEEEGNIAGSSSS